MSLQSVPFQKMRLDEEKQPGEGKVLNIRFNEEELKELQSLMDLLDTRVQASVIKLLMRIGYNVLQADLGAENLKWLARRDRARVHGARD